VNYNLFFAAAWILLGVVFLYRAHVGTRSAGILTLNHSDTVTLSKRQRWMNAGFGICYLGSGIAHMVLAYVRHAHHS
jgi:hypothetical protein